MPNIELLEKSMPVAPIRIAALEGCRELAEEVDRNLSTKQNKNSIRKEQFGKFVKQQKNDQDTKLP